MFGLFSKSNLSLQDRALLVSTLVEAHVVGYLKAGEWLGEKQRAELIGQWLNHMDRKAGAFLRFRLSEVGNEVAQHLIARTAKEDLFAFYLALDADNKEEREAAIFTHGLLLDECERLLIARNLAA